jgi:TetR/AcrR family transcriptional regulator, mexJK operon transcriptional repressor
MASMVDRRRLGRPTQVESLELDARLRQSALELLLAQGFDGTTMDAVARQAGITRRTLYARYPDKHALFVEVINWARTRHPWIEPDFKVDLADLRGALTAIARAAVARAIEPELVHLDRLVMNEWRRFPDLVLFGRSQPLSPRAQLVMDVLRWHEQSGEIAVDDMEIAAEQFLAMVSMMPARLASVGVYRPPEVEEKHIQHAVTLLIRALSS